MAKEHKEEGDIGATLHTAIQVWKFASWCAHKVPLTGPVFREIRRRRDVRVFREMHDGVLQGMRRLTVAMAHPDATEAAILPMANQLCTHFCDAVGPRLTLKQHQLHCCWKMLRRVEGGDPLLQTFGRSIPFDEGRPVRKAHPLKCSQSTIYAALTGEDDGVHRWRVFPVFCCNDLATYFLRFKTGREEWGKYYNSTLVFPLRYVRDLDKEDYDTMGFLAFNSPVKGAFADVPEIFKFQDHVGDFRDRLSDSATYHLGAIFAETLAAYLHGIYNGKSADRTNGVVGSSDRLLDTTTSGADNPKLPGRGTEASGVS